MGIPGGIPMGISLILCWCLDQWCLDQLGFSLGPSMEYTLSRIFTHIYAYLMYTYAYILIFQASIKGAAMVSGGTPGAKINKMDVIIINPAC